MKNLLKTSFSVWDNGSAGVYQTVHDVQYRNEKILSTCADPIMCELHCIFHVQSVVPVY